REQSSFVPIRRQSRRPRFTWAPHDLTAPSSDCTIMCGAISRSQYYCAGETIGACKMPSDNNREMLTEVVALYLAAHMKAQAAVITTLVGTSKNSSRQVATNLTR